MDVVVKTVFDVEKPSHTIYHTMCQFGTTYNCEQVFSILNLNKNLIKKKQIKNENYRWQSMGHYS